MTFARVLRHHGAYTRSSKDFGQFDLSEAFLSCSPRHSNRILSLLEDIGGEAALENVGSQSRRRGGLVEAHGLLEHVD